MVSRIGLGATGTTPLLKIAGKAFDSSGPDRTYRGALALAETAGDKTIAGVCGIMRTDWPAAFCWPWAGVSRG